MKSFTALCLTLTVAACGGAAPTTAPAAAQGFTIDDLVDIKHPSTPVWSPDGRHVVFVWDRAGVSNLFLSDGSGGAPTALTTDGAGGTPFWSRDGQRVYFSKGGDLWQAPVAGGSPSAVWTTPGPESEMTLSPDGARVAFVRGASGRAGSELVVQTLATGATSVAAYDERSIGGVSWSPDGARLGFSAGAHSIRHEQTPEYSGAKIIYTVTERVPGQAFVVNASGGRVVPIGSPGGGGNLRWLGSDRVVFDRQSPDFKRRSTFVADVATGTARLLREDVDEKFWSIPGNTGAAAQPSPDGKWLSFLSDRDGWDHLYVMAANGGEPVQVTTRRVRSLAAGVVARRHADRLRREPAGAAWQPAPRHRHRVRRGHAEGERGDDHQRARHQRLARVVAGWHAPRLPAHRSAEPGGPVRDQRRRAATRCGCPTRCRRRSIARRSSSPSTSTIRARTGSRCPAGCSCPRASIVRRSIRPSCGFTATA